ncbi:hypothetical protein QC820_07760, partial [Halomonas mongoliensis]
GAVHAIPPVVVEAISWPSSGGEFHTQRRRALAHLVVTVRDGGSGNWGEERMTPNRRVAEEDIERLVSWLLSLPPAEESG